MNKLSYNASLAVLARPQAVGFLQSIGELRASPLAALVRCFCQSRIKFQPRRKRSTKLLLFQL